MTERSAPGADVIEVTCTVDIEHTSESLHAYVDLEGVDIGPGDEVLVHGAPTGVGFGEHGVWQCRATVRRANALQRFWAHVEGYLELTELYEVSFSQGRVS